MHALRTKHDKIPLLNVISLQVVTAPVGVILQSGRCREIAGDESEFEADVRLAVEGNDLERNVLIQFESCHFHYNPLHQLGVLKE